MLKYLCWLFITDVIVLYQPHFAVLFKPLCGVLYMRACVCVRETNFYKSNIVNYVHFL